MTAITGWRIGLAPFRAHLHRPNLCDNNFLLGPDRVLQDLRFAPKPHPTIFIENKPEAVFNGLEKFQRSNGLSIDGVVKNKDRETGRALNKAMAEFYDPSERSQAGGTETGMFGAGPESRQGIVAAENHKKPPKLFPPGYFADKTKQWEKEELRTLEKLEALRRFHRATKNPNVLDQIRKWQENLFGELAEIRQQLQIPGIDI